MKQITIWLLTRRSNTLSRPQQIKSSKIWASNLITPWKATCTSSSNRRRLLGTFSMRPCGVSSFSCASWLVCFFCHFFCKIRRQVRTSMACCEPWASKRHLSCNWSRLKALDFRCQVSQSASWLLSCWPLELKRSFLGSPWIRRSMVWRLLLSG